MSDANLNAGEPNLETGNESNEVKTYENEPHQIEEQTGEELTGIKKKLQPKILIPIIAGVIVIVAVIVVCVVVIDKDDDDEDVEEDDTFDYSSISESWVEPYKKANAFLKDFSLDDKVMLLYSTENLIGKCVGSIDGNKERNFPGICLQDGPAGVRLSSSAQSWQAAINTAATFDRDLMFKVGAAQGKEFKVKGINIMLAPCMNILRNPLGGRVWEAYGEDPFLSGEAAAQVIKGIQSEGTIACAKHYVGNEIEDPRHNSTSNIPEQALWEIYIEPFYKSVKKGDVASIMESYNAVNYTFMTRNKRLLQEILKDTIGFNGFIMSDWWAINSDSYEHFSNGLDMNMPGGTTFSSAPTGKDGSWWKDIPTWIEKGYFTQDRVDDAARRIIAAMFKLNQIPESVSDNDIYPNYVDLDKDTITDDTKKLNREVGADSIVLLQNTDDFLPLAKNNIHTSRSMTSLKIFGNAAAESECLKGNDCTCVSDGNIYFTGYVGLGWGSGTTNFKYQVSPLQAITKKAEDSGFSSITSSTDLDGSASAGFTEKVPSASTDCASDVNIVFIAANSGEEYIIVEQNVGDRKTLDAWHDGTTLVDKVLQFCDNVVLIILGPATVTIKSEWKTNTKLKSILFGGMLGAEGGNAIADVLFGEVVPSGHLPFVWGPVDNYPNVTVTASTKSIECLTTEYTYNEGIYVGQRYFDKNNKAYDYAFGFGLSYTTFMFSTLDAKMSSTGLTVKFSVMNSGKYNGKVVPMVFLKFPIENYPEKVFKGFDKKLINSMQTAEFEILIDDHDLSYYDVDSSSFVRPKTGEFTVYVGRAANDIQMSTTVSASY